MRLLPFPCKAITVGALSRSARISTPLSVSFLPVASMLFVKVSKLISSIDQLIFSKVLSLRHSLTSSSVLGVKAIYLLDKVKSNSKG